MSTGIEGSDYWDAEVWVPGVVGSIILAFRHAIVQYNHHRNSVNGTYTLMDEQDVPMSSLSVAKVFRIALVAQIVGVVLLASSIAMNLDKSPRIGGDSGREYMVYTFPIFGTIGILAGYMTLDALVYARDGTFGMARVTTLILASATWFVFLMACVVDKEDQYVLYGVAGVIMFVSGFIMGYLPGLIASDDVKLGGRRVVEGATHVLGIAAVSGGLALVSICLARQHHA